MLEKDNQLALSTGLTAKTNQLCLGLESGAADILELVTPTTAELLMWWFGEDMVIARSGLNFHAGQKQAILNAIVAHEVLGHGHAHWTLLDLYKNCAPDALLESEQKHVTGQTEVHLRHLSEVPRLMMRESHSVEVGKCIYTRLAWPAHNGGLERTFIHWAQADTQVQAFCKISENRHTFARLRYVKDDGLPAFYSPDFLVRTAGAVYLVETKAQQQTIHPNVQRKLKAAVAWCERINGLSVGQRGGAPWHYVLLAENVVTEWQAKGERLAELLDYARLRPLASASLQQQLI